MRWLSRFSFSDLLKRAKERESFEGVARMAKAGLSQVYNLYASTYDATFGRALGYRLGHAIRKLSLRPGMKILDVGVGTGLTLKYYPRYVDVVGIDLSEGMLSMAEKRIRELQLKNARVMLGNAQQMPF